MTIPTIPPSIHAPFILGFDASAAQGRLDMETMAATYAFGIFKATDGRESVDDQWAHSSAAARDIDGWTWGAYGVIEPYSADAVQAQVDNFVKHTDGSGAQFWVCDFELANGLPAKTALLNARDWMQGVSSALGSAGVLYCGPGFIDELETLDKGDPELQQLLADLAAWPVWLADYRLSRHAIGAPELPRGWSDWAIWQLGPFQTSPNVYGSTVPGTRIGLDLNVCRGDVAAFKAALSVPGYEPTTP